MIAKPKTKKAKKISGDKKLVKERYFEARGSRKTSVARVRIYEKKIGIIINDKDLKEYFKMLVHQEAVTNPLKLLNQSKLGATVKVYGGGLTGQAEAVRHGISRALVKLNPEFKVPLRQAGFLTRDSRMVERKKYGLKKARRAPQWAKR